MCRKISDEYISISHLSKKYELLILDEATSGLDPVSVSPLPLLPWYTLCTFSLAKKLAPFCT